MMIMSLRPVWANSETQSQINKQKQNSDVELLGYESMRCLTLPNDSQRDGLVDTKDR
jgi:hypothetical protein